MKYSFLQKLSAEFLGSLILVFTAISPTILCYQALGESLGLAVLMYGITVGLVLFFLIEVLGPISQCHINPAVTLSMMVSRKMDARTGVPYIIVQFLGGLSGTIISHLMFIHESLYNMFPISEVTRTGRSYITEFVVTFIMVLIIHGCIYSKSNRAGLIIGFFVGGVMITISSGMSANPQVTIARMFTFAIAGIRPSDAIFFVIIEIFAALAATFLAELLFGNSRPDEVQA